MKNTQPTHRIQLVFLHGWAIDPHNEQKWQPFFEELRTQLSSTALSVSFHFLPLPGLTTPLSTPWGLHSYVDWLHQQLTLLAGGRSAQPHRSDRTHSVLFGHSFGGQLAIRYTRLFPEDVSALILLDAAGIRPFTLKAKVKRAVFRVAAKFGKVLLPFGVEQLGRAALHRLARERDYLEASPVMRATMQAVLKDEVLLDLPYLALPTLILWGEHDQVTPLSHAKLLADGIRTSHLQVISGARHSPHYTHIRPVAQHVVKFLLTLRDDANRDEESLQ